MKWIERKRDEWINACMNAWLTKWKPGYTKRKERQRLNARTIAWKNATKSSKMKWNPRTWNERTWSEMQWMKDWMWRNEGMKKERKEGINEWRSEWVMNANMSERKKEWINEWMKEWRNESMNQWTNESMNQWMRAWMKMKLKMNMKEEANAAMKQWMHMLPTWSSRNFWTPQFLNIDTRIVKCKFWLWELRAPFERYSSVVWATFEPVYRVKCVQRIVMAEVRKYNTFRQKDLLGEKR